MTMNSPTPTVPSRRKRWFLLGLLVILLAGGVVGFILWPQSNKPVEPPLPNLTEVDPDIVKAINQAHEEVVKNSDSGSAWGGLGMLYQAHQFYSEAGVCYARAQQLADTEPRWFYLHGKMLLEQNPKDALPKLRRAVELFDAISRETAVEVYGPGLDTVRLSLAETLWKLGRLDEAEEEYHKILRQEPADPRAHLGLARLYTQRKVYNKSLAHLEKACPSPLTQKAAHQLLAEVQERLRDRSAVSRALQRAESLPADPPVFDPLMMAVENLRIGKGADVLRVTQLRQQGRHQEAEQLQREVEWKYRDLNLLVEGRVQMEKGNYTAAESFFRQALQMAPTSLEVLSSLGKALYHQAQYEQAAATFRRIIKMEATYGPAHFQLGRCLQQQGHPNEAIASFRSAVSYAPLDGEVHRELGALLLGQGQRAEAREHLQHAVELNPQDDRARKMLSELQKP